MERPALSTEGGGIPGSDQQRGQEQSDLVQSPMERPGLSTEGGSSPGSDQQRVQEQSDRLHSPMERPGLSTEGGGSQGSDTWWVQEQNDRVHSPDVQPASRHLPQQEQRDQCQHAHQDAHEQTVPVQPHREAQEHQQRLQEELLESRRRRRQTRLEASSVMSSTSEDSSTFTATSSTTSHSLMSGHSAASSGCDLEARRREKRSSHYDMHSARLPLIYRPMGWSGLFTMRYPAACGVGRRQSSLTDVFGLHACMLFCCDFHRPRRKLGAAGAMTSYLTLCHDASVHLATRYHKPLAMFSPQIHVMDFATCAEECRLYIDGLFQALSDFSFESPMFSGDCVGPDSRLVFASVALFDSKLPAQFQPSRGWFRDACGSASAVRTLRRLGAPYRTARCDDIAVTLLEVPYNSPLLESLVVFLPDSPFGGLTSLERSLSKDKIMECLDRLEQRGLVDVTLPRLRLCCATDFARLLPAMGVRDAFGDAADFSDMTGAGAAGRLKVSAAKHFAVFRLGLRSAAARSEARLTGLPPIADCADGRNLEFTVDRPFLFLVLGKDPSSVVFLGSVTKPSV